MRRICGILLVFAVAACGRSAALAEPDRIDIRVTGAFAKDITLTKAGEGHVHEDRWPPDREARAFRVSASEAVEDFHRLEPFLMAAEPVTDRTLAKVDSLNCPDGRAQGANDMGGIYLRWSGKDVNKQYWANFNCDPTRNEAIYHQLDEVVSLVEKASQR